MTPRAAAVIPTDDEAWGGTEQMDEARKARDKAFNDLVALGLYDSTTVRLACSLMWNKGAQWALAQVKEEIAK